MGGGWGRGGRLFEAGRLLTFSANRMGAYSRWALIRGWALIRINTVSNNDGDGYESVNLKVKSRCFKLYHVYRAYSISYNSSNLGSFCLELNSKRLYRSSGKEE